MIAAIGRAETSAGTFFEQVQAWQRIPRAFATMKDSERELVTPSSLRRWLNAELNRPGVLSNGAAFDDELVDYMVGLLEHPDFCQPDLLVLELHEFLGSNVSVSCMQYASSGSRVDDDSSACVCIVEYCAGALEVFGRRNWAAKCVRMSLL